MSESAAIHGFSWPDEYARAAFGVHHDIGSSFADSDLFVAARGVSETVIPGHDESALALVGEQREELEVARGVLLGRRQRRDLWSEYTLTRTLQSYVSQLMYNGEVWVQYQFARSSATEPYLLVRTVWLPPETLLLRGDRVEQFISRRAFEQSFYGETSGRDRLIEIPLESVFRISWPFPTSGANPAKAARRLGREVAKQSKHSLLAGHAAAHPDESFLPVARGRAGAFRDALEQQKNCSARIKDMLLYPGTDEAEYFPWIDQTTDYFAADRILRSRTAICRLREYLLHEFNRQVLDRWSELNGWKRLRLELAPTLFTSQDWSLLRSELRSGDITLADVKAAIDADREAGRSEGR